MAHMRQVTAYSLLTFSFHWPLCASLVLAAAAAHNMVKMEYIDNDPNLTGVKWYVIFLIYLRLGAVIGGSGVPAHCTIGFEDQVRTTLCHFSFPSHTSPSPSHHHACTCTLGEVADLRFWGCGLGFALFFLALIDMLHGEMDPWNVARIPRVSHRSSPTSISL